MEIGTENEIRGTCMYAFESKGARKPLHVMVIGSFVGAILLFSLSNRPGMPMPMLFQLGAILCMTAAVYLTVRYSLKIYRYAVEPSGIVSAEGVELCDLVITEITGKKQRVVTRVALRDIDHTAVAVVRRADKEAYAAITEAYRAPWQVFRYANTPMMAEICVIPMPEEKAVIFIPADERMVKILKEETI